MTNECRAFDREESAAAPRQKRIPSVFPMRLMECVGFERSSAEVGSRQSSGDHAAHPWFFFPHLFSGAGARLNARLEASRMSKQRRGRRLWRRVSKRTLPTTQTEACLPRYYTHFSLFFFTGPCNAVAGFFLSLHKIPNCMTPVPRGPF